MKKIAVIGDIILDIYEYGNVSRISPEFPVVILKSSQNEKAFLPGGAANVAYQFKYLDINPVLFGFADKETYEYLKDIDTSGIIVSEQLSPRKIRFYHEDYPLLRWDKEDKNNYDNNLLLNKFIDRIDEFEIVLISDYDKGTLNEDVSKKIIEECNKRNIKTIVDSKKNYKWFDGCSIFKPNEKEAKDILKQDFIDVIKLQKIINCKSVVVTSSGSGFIGSDENLLFCYKNQCYTKEVNSVIGAGDCFLAFLSYCLYNGYTLENASYVAFNAGVCYVKQKHNHPVSWYEVHRKIDPIGSKICNLKQCKEIVDNIFNNYKWIFTNGCFDIIHAGHINTLSFAKSKGDKLIVAVNSDSSVKKLKGESRPIIQQDERAKILASMEFVDLVLIFDEEDPFKLIKEINPSVVVKGSEYKGLNIVPEDFSGEVAFAPMYKDMSTSKIIKSINIY